MQAWVSGANFIKHLNYLGSLPKLRLWHLEPADLVMVMAFVNVELKLYARMSPDAL